MARNSPRRFAGWDARSHKYNAGKTSSQRRPGSRANGFRELQKDGIDVLLEHSPKKFFKQDGKDFLECEHKGQRVQIGFDKVLIALGRKANTTGFGLEELGVELTPRKTIQVDEYMRTNYPNIYACGDVAGPYQFTHIAAHQAWYCAVNSLLSPFYSFKVDYRTVPWCTYTDPEVARSGLNELEAKEQGIPYEVTTYGIDDLDRAITDEAAYGMVKVLTEPGKDKIIRSHHCRASRRRYYRRIRGRHEKRLRYE